MAAQWCLATLTRVVADLSVYNDDRYVPILWTQHNIEIVYRELAALEVLGDLDTISAAALQLTGNAIGEIQQLQQSSLASSTPVHTTPLVYDGFVGRPRYEIPASSLEFLVADCGFSVPQISKVLNVSVRTICRGMS